MAASVACRYSLSALRRFVAAPGVQEEWPDTVNNANKLLDVMAKEGSGDAVMKQGRKRKLLDPQKNHKLQMQTNYQTKTQSASGSVAQSAGGGSGGRRN